eukprot:g4899.t1
MKQAVRLHQKGRHEQAEKRYSKVLTANPSHVGALHLMGVLAHQAGHNDKAVDWIRRALDVDPTFSDAHFNLALVYEAEGRIGEAEACYRQAVETDSENLKAHLNLGNLLFQRDDFSSALKCYDTVLALAPADPLAHKNRSRALRAMNSSEESLKAVARAVELRPDDALFQLEYGNALRDDGHPQKAVEHFLIAERLQPDNISILCNLGGILKDLNRQDEAEEKLNRAIEIDPDCAEAYVNLANLALDREDHQKSVDLIDQALAIRPEYAEAYCTLGRVLSAQAMNEDAFSAFQKAIEISPKFAEAYVNLGSVLQTIGRPEEALRAYEIALNIKPKMDMAYWNLALALLSAGRLDEGPKVGIAWRSSLMTKTRALYHTKLTDWIKLLQSKGVSFINLQYDDVTEELNELQADHGLTIHQAYEDLVEMVPEMAMAYYNLGNALHADGQGDEAVFAFESAIEHDPSYVPSFINLAGVLNSGDRAEEALALSDKALELLPSSRSAMINRGNSLKTLVRFDEAEAQYRELIALNRSDATAHDLLGTVLQGQARIDEAISEYRIAIDLDGKEGLYKGDLSIALLANGSLTEGWKLYEARFGGGDALVRQRRIGLNTWQGESLAGKTLYIWREQGVGDDVRFASCFNDIINRAKEEGGKVLIETDPRLMTLYERSFPFAEIRAEGDVQFDGDIDYDIAAGSLPGLVRTNLSEFPSTGGYLLPKPDQVAQLRADIDALGSGLKVGIAWRSRNMTANRRRFYTELEDWKGLFGNSNIQLINLQYDTLDEEINDVNSRLDAQIHQVAGLDLMNDLDGAAALTTAMDVVISAPVSVADIAGAVGSRCFAYGPHRHPIDAVTDQTLNLTAVFSSIASTDQITIAFDGGTAVAITVGGKTVSKFISSINGLSGISASITSNGSFRIEADDGSDLVIASGVGSVATDLGINGTFDNGQNRTQFEGDFNGLRTQIDELALDASYQGINLLSGDDLTVNFNESQTSQLTIQGVTLNSAGLGVTAVSADDFTNDATIRSFIAELDGAISTLRAQASTFGANLGVVEIRQGFTDNMVNTLETGAAKLTLADTNEEGANLLALQTRQSLGTTALSIAAQAEQNVLQLF